MTPQNDSPIGQAALRAALAENELDHRKYLDEKLDGLRQYLDRKLEMKATIEAFNELSRHTLENTKALTKLEAEGSPEAQQALRAVTEIREGKLPVAVKVSIDEQIRLSVQSHTAASWLLRSNKAAVVVVAVSILSLIATVIFDLIHTAAPVK